MIRRIGIDAAGGARGPAYRCVIASRGLFSSA
jgi:hypothetical protein